VLHGEDLVASAPRAYRVVGVVGHGGFGTVYRAELVGPGGFVRRVALKVLNPELEADAELGQRLRDEARMLGLVRHRAIVYVDELTVLDGRWTVVMELVEGADLRKLLDEGPMPVTAALEVAAEVASALATAHTATGPDGLPLVLLHRDLKPSNLLLTPHGDVKIVDFGVARGQFAGREAATREFAFGSPGYMPPERTELVECPEGDVYSLGAVLYELVTGERFGRAHLGRRKHTRRVEEALASAKAQGVPAPVCALIGQMLSFEVLDRPDARTVERRARQLRAQLQGPWLRDWAPDALRALPPERDEVTAELPEPSEPSEPSPAAKSRSAAAIETARALRDLRQRVASEGGTYEIGPTRRVETQWESRDVDHTVASRPHAPDVTMPPPRLPPPRLPPARRAPDPLAPMTPPKGAWPVSWSDLPTVMMDEPAPVGGMSWPAQAGWALLAVAPVPVVGLALGAGSVVLWLCWQG
jgi:serine/threonine protein kinase